MWGGVGERGPEFSPRTERCLQGRAGQGRVGQGSVWGGVGSEWARVSARVSTVPSVGWGGHLHRPHTPRKVPAGWGWGDRLRVVQPSSFGNPCRGQAPPQGVCGSRAQRNGVRAGGPEGPGGMLLVPLLPEARPT